MELKSALFKIFLFIVKQIKCFYMNVTCLCRRAKTFRQPLVSADWIKSKKEKRLGSIFIPSLFTVDLWVCLEEHFTQIVCRIQTHELRLEAEWASNSIHPFRQCLTFVAKFSRKQRLKDEKAFMCWCLTKILSIFWPSKPRLACCVQDPRSFTRCRARTLCKQSSQSPN